MPSVPTSTNAPNADGALSAARTRTASSSPAEATEVILTKSRRFTFTTSMSHLLRGAMNRGADAHVGAAPAEIAVHGLIDLRVAGMLRLSQKRGGVHDLPGLAVAALGDFFGDPGFLQRMRSICGKPFDCGDLLLPDVLQRRGAGANRLAIREDGTRSAEARSTAEFRARHPELVAQDPQQRCVLR